MAMDGAYHVSSNKRTKTVKDFLREPRYIAKAIEVDTEAEMLSSFVLNTNYNAEGGTVGFDKAPSKYPVEEDEDLSIAEGANYPEVHMDDERLTKEVEKFARKMYVTFEDERRNQMGPLQRGIKRMRNLMIRGQDKMAITVLDTDTDILVLQTSDLQVATTIDTWATATADKLLEYLFVAKKMVASEAEAYGGISYNPNTLLIGEDLATILMLKKDIRDAIVDEENVVYNGTLGRLAGLTIATSPYMLPDEAWVLERGAVGGKADETPLTVKPPRRDEDRDRHILQIFRHTTAFVTDPGAMVKIQGAA
jgi:hypothetical protein